MGKWTARTITEETLQPVPLTNTRFEEYTVEVKEGSGINLTLFTGLQGVVYPNLASGDIRRNPVELLLRELAYTVSRTQGHTGPFQVVVSWRIA